MQTRRHALAILSLAATALLTRWSTPGVSAACALTPNQVFGTCDFSGQVLPGVDVSGSNFGRSRWVGTDLSGANLSGSRLGSADFTGADLSGANLSNVQGGSANFTDATLLGANTSGWRPANAVFCHTIMPNGDVNDTGC